MTTSDTSVGFGRVKPADAPEYAEITIRVNGGLVTEASFACAQDETLCACAAALCRAVAGFPAADILQINNNVIYYNLETDLPREKMYLASVCVLAAKRAAADWCRKNGVPFDPGCCDCV